MAEMLTARRLSGDACPQCGMSKSSVARRWITERPFPTDTLLARRLNAQLGRHQIEYNEIVQTMVEKLSSGALPMRDAQAFLERMKHLAESLHRSMAGLEIILQQEGAKPLLGKPGGLELVFKDCLAMIDACDAVLAILDGAAAKPAFAPTSAFSKIVGSISWCRYRRKSALRSSRSAQGSSR